MTIVCLDMEGVLTPENWIAFADKVGIPEFKLTTRDEPDFDKLMHYRIDLMKTHGFTLDKLIDVINTIEPFEGAKDFIARLREKTQVVIISDTFDIFGRPLMRKLGWPMLFHNTVEVDADGYMSGYKLRSQNTKRDTVRGLQACGAFNFCQWLGEIAIPNSVTTLGKDAFSENWHGAPTITIGNGVETIAAGDGYNDLEMIRASKAGFLFRAPDKIKESNPDVTAFEEYDDLYNAILEEL